MNRPALTATYRLQMNAGFTLIDARNRVDYFARLGVSHLYLSPIFAARRGSMHGYDVVDPTRINLELGTEDDLRALSRELEARGMGIILDIVPNHMGIGPENRYWDDVLTHGESSRYARWFDIDWTGHKVVLPILGDTLDHVMEKGELAVSLVGGGTPRIAYFGQSFPIDPDSMPPDLQLAQADPEEAGTLAEQYSSVESREQLRKLLEAQHYRLVFWRAGATQINYRRFFDVSDLAALRMEDPAVFDETHRYLLGLVNERVVDGLRIDHIDGLRRPAEYLTRLRSSVSQGTPIFVEKVLAPTERLPRNWPVQGTTGYEFLNEIDDVFVDPDGFAAIERNYRRTRRLGADATFSELARLSKMKMLGGPLRADLNRLVALLEPLTKQAGHSWSADELANTLIYLLAGMPVYRTYITSDQPVDDADRAAIDAAAEAAVGHGGLTEIVAFIRDVVLGRVPSVDAAGRLAFVDRLQQLSSPATAKGVEDTAFYAYVPLASRNEVGGTPAHPLTNAVARLHQANLERAANWPLCLLATNTHDTKRSADVRERLAALSEIPEEWERSLRRWRRLNDKHRSIVRGRMAPDRNGEYLVYQTLVALWPPPRAGRRLDDLPDRGWRETARDRLTRYMLKAVREAKSRTSWVDPDTDYERALTQFLERVLQSTDDAPFLTDVARVVSRVALIGSYNSFARIAVHLTSPGTPDIYQGDELWNYALVDPDNRRQVDYDAREAMLSSLHDLARRLHDAHQPDLFANDVKLLFTHRLLDLRRGHAELFARGSYRELAVNGPRAEHVIAFVRSFNGQHVLTVAPRIVSSLVGSNPEEWWMGTTVELPHDAHAARWASVILDQPVGQSGQLLEVGNLLRKLPVMVAVN